MLGNIIITQKERTILQDQLRHEEVCVRKYTDYARRTADAALRGMFNEFAQDERDHYNTLNGLLGGSQGRSQQGGMGQQQGAMGQQQGAMGQQQGAMGQQQGVSSRFKGAAGQVPGATTQQTGPAWRGSTGRTTGMGQAGGVGPTGNVQAGSTTPGGAGGNLTARLTDEEFIHEAAEQKLQSMGLGQSQVIGQGGQGLPSQGTSQSKVQGQGQSPPSGQLRNWPDTDLSSQRADQPPAQQSTQASQEASHELIPMFKSETAQEFAGGTGAGENEAGVARDMLMTEQFVSGSYDAAIFDSIGPEVRQTLQHIQKDEQKHGEGLRNYLRQRGMSQ